MSNDKKALELDSSYMGVMRQKMLIIADQKPPSEAVWEEARAILSGRLFRFEGEPGLDDTADTAYHLRLDNESLKTVVSGILYQAAHGARMVIRRFEPREDGDVDMVMSEGSTYALKRLVPSIQVESFSKSAGHFNTL